MIIVGWTRYPSPATLAVLSGYAHHLHYVGNSDSDYFEFLAGWWRSGEREIVILEHDIEPQRELIEEMRDCPRAWCAAMYSFEERYLYGLGLTKFNLSMRQTVPDLFDQIALLEDQHHPRKHWCRLDAHMQNTLKMQSGQAPHLHEGAIVHTNLVRSHVACRPSA